jgi:hypothetical protein
LKNNMTALELEEAAELARVLRDLAQDGRGMVARMADDLRRISDLQYSEFELRAANIVDRLETLAKKAA